MKEKNKYKVRVNLNLNDEVEVNAYSEGQAKFIASIQFGKKIRENMKVEQV